MGNQSTTVGNAIYTEYVRITGKGEPTNAEDELRNKQQHLY
jgi:hypothetical protein